MISLISKPIVQALGAILVLLAPVLTGGVLWTSHDWINFAIAAVGVVTIYLQTNYTAGVARYAKFIESGVLAGLVVLNNVISGGVTTTELWQIAFAVLTALGVLVVRTSAPKRAVGV